MLKTLPVSVNGATELRSFNKLLPSEPVMLDRFGGDYANIGVIYNQGRIMSFHLHRDELLGDLFKQYRQMRRESKAGDAAFRLSWARKDDKGEFIKDAGGDYIYEEEKAGYDEAAETRAGEVTAGLLAFDALDRAIRFAKFKYLVIDFVWPYADKPSPQDQQDLEDALDGYVLDWIVNDETLLEVAQQIGNPKEKKEPTTQ